MLGITEIGDIILAASVLGTAAFGIVEGLKWTWIGRIGFGSLLGHLGAVRNALEVAYGTRYMKLLQAQYVGDQAELILVLRQGARIGLSERNAKGIAEDLGLGEYDQLTEAAKQTAAGEPLTTELRNVLGRFELAVDARIDAANNLAQNKYTGGMRISASILSLLIAIIVYAMAQSDEKNFLIAFLVGIAAVPLAPIAKDVVTALQAAGKAIGRKQ